MSHSMSHKADDTQGCFSPIIVRSEFSEQNLASWKCHWNCSNFMVLCLRLYQLFFGNLTSEWLKFVAIFCKIFISIDVVLVSIIQKFSFPFSSIKQRITCIYNIEILFSVHSLTGADFKNDVFVFYNRVHMVLCPKRSKETQTHKYLWH